jgi:hypothetical protein
MNHLRALRTEGYGLPSPHNFRGRRKDRASSDVLDVKRGSASTA